MRYTKEICDRMCQLYQQQMPVEKIAVEFSVPERSIIAKLSSLGVYQKKTYLNKRGELPVRKAEHIERIAQLLSCDLELLESLEKVNKVVLKLIEQRLQDPKPQQPDPKLS